MDSRSDQFERHCHLRIKLEDAIELLGPGDFVRSHAPGKAADATQMLCFRKERFPSLQRRFAQGPLDGYAGNVGNLRDEILLNLCRARWFAVKNRKGSQHPAVSIVNWRGPMLQPLLDMLVRLSRAPVVSIASIRGRATGVGSELALACDMRFASREKAILSHFEVGAGVVPGGGPMARLPRLMGRGRALEVLLGADDIPGRSGRTIRIRQPLISGC